jgi:hypothetical protein
VRALPECFATAPGLLPRCRRAHLAPSPRPIVGTAFEAYLLPTGAEGYQEVSVNGTETTYTDRTFLSTAFAGVLQAGATLHPGTPAAPCTSAPLPPAITAQARPPRR